MLYDALLEKSCLHKNQQGIKQVAWDVVQHSLQCRFLEVLAGGTIHTNAHITPLLSGHQGNPPNPASSCSAPSNVSHDCRHDQEGL